MIRLSHIKIMILIVKILKIVRLVKNKKEYLIFIKLNNNITYTEGKMVH
jgi:hypothetical protein